MKTNKNDFLVYTFLFACMMFTGCTSNMKAGNLGHLQTYPIHSTEPVWIRDGEPIEFEGEMWYPVDGVETLMDSEVYILGEYRGTQFFVDKIDVRPYGRLYTKFGKNKFRYFERRLHD